MTSFINLNKMIDSISRLDIKSYGKNAYLDIHLIKDNIFDLQGLNAHYGSHFINDYKFNVNFFLSLLDKLKKKLTRKQLILIMLYLNIISLFY